MDPASSNRSTVLKYCSQMTTLALTWKAVVVIRGWIQVETRPKTCPRFKNICHNSQQVRIWKTQISRWSHILKWRNQNLKDRSKRHHPKSSSMGKAWLMVEWLEAWLAALLKVDQAHQIHKLPSRRWRNHFSGEILLWSDMTNRNAMEIRALCK